MGLLDGSGKGDGFVVGDEKARLKRFAWRVAQLDQGPAEGRTDRRFGLLLLIDYRPLRLLVLEDLLALQVSDEEVTDHLLLPGRRLRLTMRERCLKVPRACEGKLRVQSLGRRDWRQSRRLRATLIFSHNNYGHRMTGEEWKK